MNISERLAEVREHDVDLGIPLDPLEEAESDRRFLLTILSDKMVNAFREMGLQLHGYHSNVGPVKRLEEWKNCRYHFCKERYAIIYPEEEGKKGLKQ